MCVVFLYQPTILLRPSLTLKKVFHPDKAASAAGLGPEAAHAIFKLLSEAHRVLADAEARRHHDIAALRFKYRRFYSHAGL